MTEFETAVITCNSIGITAVPFNGLFKIADLKLEEITDKVICETSWHNHYRLLRKVESERDGPYEDQVIRETFWSSGINNWFGSCNHCCVHENYQKLLFTEVAFYIIEKE